MSSEMKLIHAEDLFYKPLDSATGDQLVEDLIPFGLTVIAGAPKSGKSWMMLDLALAVSSGRQFLGKETKQCGVLYCALEDTEARLQNRLLQFEEVPSSELHFVKSCEKFDAGFRGSLRMTLEKYPEIRLVIVDTLQKIRGSEGDKRNVSLYEKDDAEISLLKKFADAHGVAIILVHHLRKMRDAADPLNEISGSTGITGATDTILLLKKERAGNGAVMLVTGRDLQQRQLVLQFACPRWNVIQEKTEEEMAKEHIPDVLFSAVDFIKTRGKWAGTATELLQEIGAHETNPSAFSAAITKHYYDVFLPEQIEITFKRNAGRRERTFIYQPAVEEIAEKNDAHDADDGVSAPAYDTASSPSLASLDELNERLETMFTMP